ncbi:MAG: MFS transporter [Candidatus Bathyarchaeia archaeon]
MDSTVKNLLITYSVFFFMGVMFSLDAIMPLFFSSIGVSVNEWGVLAATFGLGMLILEVTWGTLSDRFGKIIFMTGGLLLTALIIPMYTITVFLPLFFLLQFLRGGFGVMIGPTGRAFVCHIVPLKKLGTAIGLLWASSSLGNAVGSVLFSYVADKWSYASSFYLCSLLLFLAGVSASIGLRKTNSHEKPNRKHNGKMRRNLFSQSLKSISKTKATSIILSFAIISFIQLGLIRTFIPIYASQILNTSTFMVGLTQAVFNGFSVSFLPVCGIISDRIDKKYAIMIGFFVCFISSIFYALTKDIYQLLFTTVGVSFGFSLLAPSILALLPTLIPKDVQGAVIGLYGSFENLGLMMAPIIFSFVWNFNPVYIFYACSTAQTFGIALAYLLKEPNNFKSVSRKITYRSK